MPGYNETLPDSSHRDGSHEREISKSSDLYQLLMLSASLTIAYVLYFLGIEAAVWCTAWALIYAYVIKRIIIFLSGRRANEMYEGSPRWGYWMGALHQGIILPTIMLISVICSSHNSFSDWFMSDCSTLSVERQVHFSIVGVMIKDLILHDMEYFFVIHHACSVAGCCLCLGELV